MTLSFIVLPQSFFFYQDFFFHFGNIKCTKIKFMKEMLV